LQITLKIPKV